MVVLTFGERVFLGLVAIYYIFPSIVNIIYPLDINERLAGDPHWVAGLLFSILFCCLFLVIKRLFFSNFKNNNIDPKGPWIYSRGMRWVMMLVFVVVSIKFSADFTGKFRHLQAYASSGFIPLAYYMLKTYHIIGLLVYLSDAFSQKKDTAYCVTFLVCVFTTMSGSFDAAIIVVCLYAALKGNRGIMSRASGFVLRSKITMAIVPFLVLSAALTTKGANASELMNSISALVAGAGILVSRLSHHAYHFAHFIVSSGEWFSYWDSAFEILSDQTARRLYVLLGMEYQTESYQTISRLNYVVFSPNSGLPSGSSPGIFGSFVYIPFGPVGLPILGLFVAYVMSCMDKIMGRDRYSWPVYLLALLILVGIISSPLDTLNIFSSSFFAFILLAVSAYSVSGGRRVQRS